MNEYDQTFNPSILIGHYDLISRFSDFALCFGIQLVYELVHELFKMSVPPDLNRSPRTFSQFWDA